MDKDKLKILIEGCIKNKPNARKDLYDKYHRMLMGTCLRYARDNSEAEDILLDGFMQIYSKIETFSFQGSFEGWMKKIMVNTAIDYFRKNKKENFHQDIDEYPDLLSTDPDVLMQLSAKEIMGVVQTMPQGYRMVFNFFAIEGFSHKEIAEKLQITESTSKSQMRKARVWLVKKLIINNA